MKPFLRSEFSVKTLRAEIWNWLNLTTFTLFLKMVIASKQHLAFSMLIDLVAPLKGCKQISVSENRHNEQSFYWSRNVRKVLPFRCLIDPLTKQHIGLFCCQGLKQMAQLLQMSSWFVPRLLRFVFRVNVASSDFAKISPIMAHFRNTNKIFFRNRGTTLLLAMWCVKKRKDKTLKKVLHMNTTVFWVTFRFFLHYLFIRDPSIPWIFPLFDSLGAWHLTQEMLFLINKSDGKGLLS